MIINNNNRSKQFKELKVKIPIDYRITLYEIKTRNSEKMGDIVKSALDLYFDQIKNNEHIDIESSKDERKEIRLKLPKVYHDKLYSLKMINDIKMETSIETALGLYFDRLKNKQSN